MTKKKVLIVEDDEMIRQTLEIELKLKGHEYASFDNGGDAWAILEKGQKFDRIISDFIMPGMNGLALLKKIRGLRSTAHIPFVMVSASDVAEQPCREMGGLFVLKPCDHEQLIETYVDSWPSAT
ncbi:MAG: response regulator [Candidatus Zambryskibacteria bacterium]|nr:response regulator [Candidatus Zambryskibacteria bacterium]